MVPPTQKRPALFAGLLLLTFAAGCGPTRVEKIEQVRSRYQASVNGWVIEQDPAANPPRQTVRVDLVLSHDSPEKLPGVTLDVAQSGPDRKEKRRWRVWVDSSGIEPGPGEQISQELSGAEVSLGDRFTVEVLHPVPDAERDQYREFSGEAS